MHMRLFLGLLLGVALLAPAGQVVVYSALDREFSEPILSDYETRSGTEVLPKFDVESTKTVGLTQLLIKEGARPRCDVFWNNEIVNTIRLKNRGLLAKWTPANAADFPEAFRDKDGYYYGFAARARVLIVNTKLVAEKDRPKGIQDLLDPKWKGKVAVAKPLFGTTATHAACLWATWGEAKTKQFFRDLKANGVQIQSGNKQVAKAVASGEAAFGLTDTDDAIIEIEANRPVMIVYPDREPAQMGTLFIPNTLAILKGSPNPGEAESLASALLRPAVEDRLAAGPSAQIPLNRLAKASPRVETPRTIHAMAVDFEAAAKVWDDAVRFLAGEFQ